MTRKEVIEKLRIMKHKYMIYKNSFADAIDIAVKELSASEWVIVADRLPDDMTCVLTTIHIPGREPVVRSGFHENGLFHNDNGDVWKATDIEVLAWLPLPEPYKEQTKRSE